MDECYSSTPNEDYYPPFTKMFSTKTKRMYGRLQKKTLQVARKASRQVRKACVVNFRRELRT